MKRTLTILVAAATASYLVLAGDASALEIFRIGGKDLPRPPEASDPTVEFHQLSWSDFQERDGFNEEAFAEGILRPLQLSLEDNIALTSISRGGGPFSRGCGGYQFLLDGCNAFRMVDGRLDTWYLKQPYGYVFQSGDRSSWLIFDLGGTFSVNRVRLISTPGTGLYPDKLNVTTSTILQIVEKGSYGGVDPGPTVFSVAENTQDTIEVVFPTIRAREVGLEIIVSTGRNMEIAEVEIYGEGFVNRATYVTKFFDFGEPTILGELRWQGQKDPQARVDIRSRAGKTLDPNIYWRNTGRGDELSRFDGKGKLLDAKGYSGLKQGEAADITYDVENWSFWSPPYEFADSSGTSVLSPSPNSVFQFRVDFQPDALQGGELEFVEFSITKPPLAQNVIGEIYPPEVPLGEVSQFVYTISPTMTPNHSGFDQIEISAPFGFAGVDSVEATGLVDYAVQVERSDSTLFSVKLSPRREAGNLGGPIKVYFGAPVLRYGTPFDGWVRDTERPLELAQRINPGNAAPELVSETLAVRTSLSARLLADLRVEPIAFTPNGDGVNDITRFSFSLLQVTEDVPLRLEIFDLSGRLLRLQEELHKSGRLGFSWDGRDDRQELVAPGLYLYRIVVEAKNGDDLQTGTLAVVY
jgi:hypothetical protein